MAQEVTPATLPRVSLVGEVYDSIGNRPFVGAVVQLVPTDGRRAAWSVSSDARGRYRIDSIIPGDYLVSFFHPVLDSLAILAPIRRVSLGFRDPQVVDLALPGARRVLAALCPDGVSTDSVAAVVGDVRDVDTGAPLADVAVVAQWIDYVIDSTFRAEPQQVVTTTARDGSFILCGLPGGGEVGIRALDTTRATGRVDLSLGPLEIARRDLRLGDGTTRVTVVGERTEARLRVDTLLRGPARLTGSVRSHEDKPVSNAIVEVWNTGMSTSTDGSGHFELRSLPVGSHMLEVRRIGFVPQHRVVQLASQSPTTVGIMLDEPVRVLEAIRVTARTVYSRREVEMARRRRLGFGHFIDREELVRSASMRVADVLRRVPGVRVLPSPSGEVVVFRDGASFSGPCHPVVYLDGMRLGTDNDINFVTMATSLDAIEVYTSAAQTPPEYWGGTCGAILLWTRMDLPRPRGRRQEKPKDGNKPSGESGV